MNNKLYGTDGIRGLYKEKITPFLAYEIGRAISVVFERKDEENFIIVGKDSRPTSDVLENALVAGINSMGTNAVKIGVVPTALVPFSIKSEKANAGVMITASSSTSEYAGFKFFNGNGYSISEEQALHIEYIIANPENYCLANYNSVGHTLENDFVKSEYANYLKEKINFSGLKILVDCANGSVGEFAKEVFENTDNNFSYINQDSGEFINKNCGSENLNDLSKKVVDGNYDYGIAFCGDGHRVRFVDGCGNILSGEIVLYYLTFCLKQKKIVTSIISNMGLINSLKFSEIETNVCEVGEKNIVNELLKNNIIFGGEKNGLMIFMEDSTTSDGILSAIKFFNFIGKESIFKYCENYLPFYQVNINFPHISGQNLEKDEKLNSAIEISENMLYESGRILFRKSGTENLYRLLIEGYNINVVENIKNEIINIISVNKVVTLMDFS